MRFGCSIRAKITLCLALSVCVFFAWEMFRRGEMEVIFVAGLPLIVLMICLTAISVVMWKRYEIDSTGITRMSPTGVRRFRRADYVTHELTNGAEAALVVRFRTGSLQLAAHDVDTRPETILTFLEREWQLRS